jgi:phosphoribosylpyrophosphate synthetase
MQPPLPYRCQVCSQRLTSPGAYCSNPLCNSPDRAFDWATAIAMKTGELEKAVWASKDGSYGWGIIFSRIVLGYLYANPKAVQGLGAIIPTPTYLPPGTDPRMDHTRWVIQQAAEQDETGLPFVYDPPLIFKTRPTTKMRASAGIGGRRIAAAELLESLVVPDRSRVEGRHIMVYDDVFTGGNTLNAVAIKLKEAGASGVYGLTLARQPWAS